MDDVHNCLMQLIQYETCNTTENKHLTSSSYQRWHWGRALMQHVTAVNHHRCHADPWVQTGVLVCTRWQQYHRASNLPSSRSRVLCKVTSDWSWFTVCSSSILHAAKSVFCCVISSTAVILSLSSSCIIQATWHTIIKQYKPSQSFSTQVPYVQCFDAAGRSLVAHCSWSMYMWVRRAWLVLGWVTIHGFKYCCTILVFNQIPRPNQPGIPPWVGKKSTNRYFTLYWAFCTKA